MSTYVWLLIISIVIWAVVIFLFKNSYDEWHWDCICDRKVWLEENRLTAPLWMYILAAISIFIPGFNVGIASVVLICLIAGYIYEDIYFHIELPEKLKFLTKEY